MKKLLTILLVLTVGALFFVSCGGEKKAEQAAQTTVEKKMSITTDMLTTAKDPVCGMELTNESIADTAIYNGQLYGFCSEECKAKFKADPDKYLANVEEEEEHEMHEKGEKGEMHEEEGEKEEHPH